MRIEMLTLTDKARQHLNFKCIEEDKEYVQLSLKPSGCAGFEYQWGYIDTVPDSTKLIDDILVVDQAAQMAITGSIVDYVTELIGSSLVITNPNVQNSCGCGVSFTV